MRGLMATAREQINKSEEEELNALRLQISHHFMHLKQN